MLIRPSMTMVPFLAVILVSPVVQAIGEPSPDARVAATVKSSRADLAVLQAPIGHRQGACRRLAKLMAELGWMAVRVRGLTRGGYLEQVRGYCRDARQRRHPRGPDQYNTPTVRV